MPSFCVYGVKFQITILINFKIRLERHTVKERYGGSSGKSKGISITKQGNLFLIDIPFLFSMVCVGNGTKVSMSSKQQDLLNDDPDAAREI